jgi:RNA polymerase sigma factor (TIGR02999 family)
MSDVTRILSHIESGDPQAADQLLPLVYDELRKLAASRLAHEKPGQTLQATALVHEAYLRLIGPSSPTPDSRPPTPSFNSRGHFFAAAAEAMRRILVERARQKQGPTRRGNRVQLELEAVCDLIDSKAEQILAINDALAHLAEESPRAAELVKLRYFGGLTQQESADCLGISRSTADRIWAYAKAALYCDLAESKG